MNDETKPNDSSRRTALRALAGSALGLGLAEATSTQARAAGKADARAPSTGPLRSAGTLCFSPDNVLFIGDIKGGSVHAFALRDRDLTSQVDVVMGNFRNFEGRDLVVGVDRQLAALLGTTYDNVVINDMVVHEPTQQIVMSVERGRGAGALPAIVKLNHGRLEVLDLHQLPHSQVAIQNVPSPSAMLEFDVPQRSFAITDIKFYKGEIFVSGVSNQRFASTLHRIAYPFNGSASATTVEIWHPVHGEFETRAPIIRQLIREVRGEPYLFAVYGCTPLVRFPLAELKPGAHVKGELIGELGYGSNPLDMLCFTDPFDQKEYLVVTIDVRSASRIAIVDLEAAVPSATGGTIDFGPGGLGKTQKALPITAEHTAILNANWAVEIQRHPKSAHRLDVSTFALPYFFERKDGMSEMNWPDGPDPFEYRKHKSDVSRGV